MKTMLLLATVAALSACTPKAENTTESTNTVTTTDSMTTANAATENTTAATASTNETAAWTGFEPGTYVVTDAKGAKADITIKADGTYSSVDAAKKTETGTFVMKGAKGCFTAKGAAEMCWSNSARAADGSWTGTADDGSAVKVMKK